MAITKNTTFEEIDKIVENFVHENLTSQEQFSLDMIKFINLNNQYYWFLLCINNSLGLFQNKIDDEGLDLNIGGLFLKGRNLNFNPYEKYRLF